MTARKSRVVTSKSAWERWQTRTAVIVALLAIVAFLLDLPEKIDKLAETLFPSQSKEQLQLQKLTGQIVDESGDPLPGVTIILPEYHMRKMTDDLGTFEFEVEAHYQAQVKLQATKEGYVTENYDPALGNHYLRFKMRRRRK